MSSSSDSDENDELMEEYLIPEEQQSSQSSVLTVSQYSKTQTEFPVDSVVIESQVPTIVEFPISKKRKFIETSKENDDNAENMNENDDDAGNKNENDDDAGNKNVSKK